MPNLPTHISPTPFSRTTISCTSSPPPLFTRVIIFKMDDDFTQIAHMMHNTSLDTSDLAEYTTTAMLSPARKAGVEYERDLHQMQSVPLRDVQQTVDATQTLHAKYSARDAEGEANELFTATAQRLSATLYADPVLPPIDVDPPASLLSLLSVADDGALPQQLTPDEVKTIHTLIESGKDDDTALQKEVELLDIQQANLSSKIMQAEETRLGLELSLARLDRALPTHDAWLREQQQKLAQLGQAAVDPCAIIGRDTESNPVDLAGLEATVKALSRQNAEMEQEGLIKSLNACHAMEMLTTSLRYQTRWCGDAEVHAANARRRSDTAAHSALEGAKEEERLLHSLHEATVRLADTKNNISLTQRRLMGAAPLPNGLFLDEARGQHLLAALKDELGRGSTRLLETLGSSHDFNVMGHIGAQAELIPAYARARSSSPPMPHGVVPVPVALSGGGGLSPRNVPQRELVSPGRVVGVVEHSLARGGGEYAESVSPLHPTQAVPQHQAAYPVCYKERASDLCSFSPFSSFLSQMGAGTPRMHHSTHAPLHEQQTIVSLQEQAQRQLAGVAATLATLASNDRLA